MGWVALNVHICRPKGIPSFYGFRVQDSFIGALILDGWTATQLTRGVSSHCRIKLPRTHLKGPSGLVKIDILTRSTLPFLCPTQGPVGRVPATSASCSPMSTPRVEGGWLGAKGQRGRHRMDWVSPG